MSIMNNIRLKLGCAYESSLKIVSWSKVGADFGLITNKKQIWKNHSPIASLVCEQLNNKKMNSDHEEVRKLAARICKDYLHGAWKDVTAHNIGFKHISGGLSNLLYLISLPDHLSPLTAQQQEQQQQDSLDSITTNNNKGRRGEPREVLIRIYGQTHGNAEGCLEALITESVIFTLLSERGLGPKLHGIFPGGRIEEYINARPLRTRDLADPVLSRLIAGKMSAIHAMEVPLHKEPDWLWGTMDRWLSSCEQRMRTELPEVAKAIGCVDLRGEARWLRKLVEQLDDCPVTFCHNDMQEGNILICQSEEDDNFNVVFEEPKLVLIDFEYCSYNYRSFDIANHFLEWVYDYTSTEHPFFTQTTDNYPNEEQRLHFVRAYLKESGSKEDAHKILKEVKVFTLASHFFWSLWGIVNADTSKIPFGYWEYAVTRLESYTKAKADLLLNTNLMAVKRKAEP